MKILIFGKDGQLGHELQRSLSMFGDIVAVGRRDCDLSDQDSIVRTIRNYMPNVIINAAAYTEVEKAENDCVLARAINASAPKVMAAEADRIDSFFVHYSSDYVFDGTSPIPYEESDIPNPINIYGLTKLEGEQAVRASCKNHLIIRTSWVYGIHGDNFLKKMLKLATECETLKIVADQVGSPTPAFTLADITADLIFLEARKKINNFLYGTYHVTSLGSASWYEYACYVISIARSYGHPIRVTDDSIIPISTKITPGRANRPLNSVLCNDKLFKVFELRMPRWEVGVNYALNNLLSGA